MIELLILLIVLAAIYAVIQVVPLPAWLKQVALIVIGAVALIKVLIFLIALI